MLVVIHLLIGEPSELKEKLMQHFNELQQLFFLWDKDDSGEMSAEELAHILKMLGRSGLEKEVYNLVNEADVDGDGTIRLLRTPIRLYPHWTGCMLTALKLHCALAVLPSS